MDIQIADLRREYTKAELSEESVDRSPIDQFETWFRQALDSRLTEPNAMVLSTVDTEGQPSQRTVLLKAFDKKGFVFYTNYSSRKSREIGTNPRVSLLFPWFGLERQVIILGLARKVSQSESLRYFLSRPKGSQLGAWVSHQSQVISSRSILEAKLEEMKRKYKDGKIPLPDFWGGYRVVPHSIEFWQGRPNRLHDRIRYDLHDDHWNIQRLAP